MSSPSLLDRVRRSLDGVDDPEYPGISITDMGMVGACSVVGGHARIVLVPTFTGCPALDFIAADVVTAVEAVEGVDSVMVEWDPATVWGTERLSDRAREIMAGEYTVAVATPGRPTTCPRCRHTALVETSMFGPTRCRSISRCRGCGETVEVMRS